MLKAKGFFQFTWLINLKEIKDYYEKKNHKK